MDKTNPNITFQDGYAVQKPMNIDITLTLDETAWETDHIREIDIDLYKEKVERQRLTEMIELDIERAKEDRERAHMYEQYLKSIENIRKNKHE